MKRLAQDALIARLTRRLEEEGSWAGETHVQKASYLLSELGEVPFDFSFILYKHGPFSFELRDELGSMRADGYLERIPQAPPYGPHIAVTERGRKLEQRFGRTTAKFGPRVDWIAKSLGDRGVAGLEQLATALWVTQIDPQAPADGRADLLQTIKPHVSSEAALAAVKEIDEMKAQVPSLGHV